MRILTVRRADVFSPNSIEKDRMILQEVADRLSVHFGVEVPMIDEDEFAAKPADADLYVTMGRRPSTLTALACKEHRGKTVINSAEGVRRCQRSLLEKIMRRNNVAMPPEKGENGYWLKRGDAAAQSKRDIVFCPDEEALAEAKRDFAERGIKNTVVSTHVVGDLVKFYGVGSDFFKCYYPSDDGISKFGDEKINGKAHHYNYDNDALHKEVVRLASLTGVQVYGGDAIIDSKGSFYIIDFNDWPSFSRCREEAADAIAQFVIHNL